MNWMEDTLLNSCLGGPKNYAFETKTGNTVQKVKGITLNYRASKIVTMDSLEKMT